MLAYGFGGLLKVLGLGSLRKSLILLNLFTFLGFICKNSRICNFLPLKNTIRFIVVLMEMAINNHHCHQSNSVPSTIN